tara:strand:+ start:71602 stop:71997 length:396 start_codon:yes stop_codon:yes gene_type:complete
MISQEFLLTSSLKTFILQAGYVPDEVVLVDDKPLSNYIMQEELIKYRVVVALMNWEIHHGLKLDIEAMLPLSIHQIVAASEKYYLTDKQEYTQHLLSRLEEIDTLYLEHAFDDSEFDEEDFDREFYLGNKN